METAVARLQEKREIRLHQHQGEVWNSTKRFNWMIAGTGGGKTWFGPYWARREIERYPNDAGMIVGPSYRMLYRNALYGTVQSPGFLRVNADLIARHKDGSPRMNKQEGWIELITGALVYLGSSEHEISLEGAHVKWMWDDEVALSSRLAWIIKQGRLGLLQGDFYGGTTPAGMNWLHKEVFLPWSKGERPDTHIVQFTSIDNPYYPVAEYERAEREMSPQMFSMRYGGKFERLEGLIWPELASKVIKPFEIPKEWVKLGGLDWGYSPHPLAYVEGYRNPNREYFITKVTKKTQMMTPEIEQMLRASGAKRIQSPPEVKRENEELKAKGLPMKEAVNAVDYGLGKVTELLRTDRLHIFEGSCVDLADEAESYHRDENGKVVKEGDDACDALRYLIASEEKQTGGIHVGIIS